MKKVLASILIIIYTAFSTGVVINHHYCMGRLDSTTLFGGDAEFCGRCGMHTESSEGCCHDEVEVVKLDDDQQKSNVVSTIPAFQQEVTQPVSAYLVQPFQNTDRSGQFEGHSPPLITGQDTYLQNRVFRI